MNDTSAKPSFIYDEVAYPTAIVSLTTPDRLMAAGLLRGWKGAEPATASLLELGCGTGANLIGIGGIHPKSRNVGFDLSASAIAIGQDLVGSAGLTNVDLHHGDILTYPRDGEKFDYIVCHGVYTWVPEHVRAATLELIAARLAPGGAAYIGYDSLPAAASKTSINRFLVQQTASIEDPHERTQRAAELMAILYRNQHDGSRQKPQLSQIAKELRDYDPAYFFHDWLAEFYQPISTPDLSRKAAAHGLAYAGDILLFDLFTDDLDPDALAIVDAAGSDLVARNHAMDMLRGERMFRQDFFVRADAPPPRNTEDPWPRLSFAFKGKREEVTDSDGQPAVKFSRADDANLVTRESSEGIVMELLHEISPNEATRDDVVARTGLNRAEVERVLHRLVTVTLIAAYATPQNFVTKPGEKPLVSDLFRVLLQRDGPLISQRHSRFFTEQEATRVFLSLCDGNRDRDELARAMSERFQPTSRERVDEALIEFGGNSIFLA